MNAESILLCIFVFGFLLVGWLANKDQKKR